MSRLVRAGGYVGVVTALIVAAATFFILMGLTPIAPTQYVVLTVLLVNGALAVFLVLVIGWEIAALVLARRRRRAAARLHIRIVALFSIVAATPAILVAVVASVTLDRGLDNWFSTSTRAIVDNSAAIAQAFIDQQVDLLDRDILGLESELERARSLLIDDPDRFQTFLAANAQARNLPGAFLVKGDGSIVAEARVGSQAQFPPPPPSAIQRAEAEPSQPALITPGSTNMVGGVAKLDDYDDVFIYALRPIAPEVLHQVTLAGENVNQYRALEATRFGIQLAFGILYLGVALVVLLSAIWLGISFANRLVAPIRRLIDAAKQVSAGNLAVRVPSKKSEGDLGDLSDTFNTMTAQLRGQREELLSANEQIDSRRRFTEAVLSGVTAGVIGIDGEGRITIANRTALRMLNINKGSVERRPITEIMPELGPVVAAALRGERPEQRDQISVNTVNRERTINVRVTTEGSSERAHGYVITLDDITDLVSAQRSSAWADVARRIAHEIKNPLTPIQLSAERLRRKFGKVVQEDREIFEQCTDTIIRQVGDIGRMVDEFSSFARMPKPTIERKNLAESIREAVFLLEVAHPEISFALDLPAEPLLGDFDARLMSQAFTNIVKNGTEAIAGLPADEKTGAKLTVSGRIEDNWIVVDVVDTGIGLPAENRHRLLEPYMTTREKGTGLGLAIVTKIIAEHGGRIELMDSPEVAHGGHGALVRVRLPGARGGAEESATAESEESMAE
ncbi:MAG: PAS domain-containing sensor histidine kinase [Bauldia litoralis]|uniref:sensor histidine kinase NtrY-like n=5 Tax=Bauldia litoralis TaxID=665467 RepID=UPI0032979CFA